MYEQVARDLLYIIQEREVVHDVQLAIVLVTHVVVLFVVVVVELVLEIATRRASIERIEVVDLQISVHVHAVRVDRAPLDEIIHARAE